MIQQKDVTGIGALNYVRQELSRGGVLSDYINKLPLDNGAIYAFVHEGTSEKKLYDFEYGALCPFDERLIEERPLSMPIPNDSRPLLVERIQQHLNLSEANCCLFEDPIRSPTDPIVSISAIDYVYLNNGSMFYFLNYLKNDASTISKTLSISEDYVLLCALSSMDVASQNKFFPNREIILNLLKEFATNVSSFFVKAYDHESYLMWVKAV